MNLKNLVYPDSIHLCLGMGPAVTAQFFVSSLPSYFVVFVTVVEQNQSHGREFPQSKEMYPE